MVWKFTRDTFEFILNEIEREITRWNTPMRQAISAIVLYYLSSTASITHLYHLCVARTTCLYRRHFCDNYACVMVKRAWKIPGTAPESFYTNESFGTVPRLPVPRLPPGGSLGTPNILGTGATLHLGPIRLHFENWGCRALKSLARCQTFGEPCRFFSSCKWGFKPITMWFT